MPILEAGSRRMQSMGPLKEPADSARLDSPENSVNRSVALPDSRSPHTIFRSFERLGLGLRDPALSVPRSVGTGPPASSPGRQERGTSSPRCMYGVSPDHSFYSRLETALVVG